MTREEAEAQAYAIAGPLGAVLVHLHYDATHKRVPCAVCLDYEDCREPWDPPSWARNCRRCGGGGSVEVRLTPPPRPSPP